MLQKTLGICMVIAATSAGGFSAANKIRDQYEQLRYLQKLVCLLRSEIQYARSYLGEAFLRIGSSARSPYKEWFLGMREEMDGRRGGIFAQIWEEKAKEYLQDSGLSEEMLEKLAGYGSQMGIADVNMQVRTLDLWQEEIELAMEEMREKMGTRIRLCHCLSVMSGIFIAVLLL